MFPTSYVSGSVPESRNFAESADDDVDGDAQGSFHVTIMNDDKHRHSVDNSEQSCFI